MESISEPNLMQYPCSSCKKECLSELVGTYLLVLVGPSSIIVASLISDFSAVESLVFVAFSFGATVALVIYFLGRHSGAVINPAITLGATFAKILHSKYFAPYLFFQLAGGLLAGLTLKLVFSPSAGLASELGSTELAKGVSPVLGLALEITGTFILTISALIASTKVKSSLGQALLVGSTLFVLILFIGPLTGAGFNPARSLGPSLASGYFTNLYVYLIGPVIGALCAGLLFRVNRDNGRKRNLVCVC